MLRIFEQPTSPFARAAYGAAAADWGFDCGCGCVRSVDSVSGLTSNATSSAIRMVT